MAGGSSPREWLCFALDLVQAPCPLLQPWDPHPNYASPSHRAPRASVRTPGRQGHLSPEAELASLQDSQRGCRWGAVLMTLGQKQQVPGGGLQLSDLPVQRQHQLPGGVLRTLGNGARRHPPLGLPQGTTCKVQPHRHHLLWDPQFVSKVSVCPQPSPSGSWCLPQSQSSFAGCPARRLRSSG